MAALALAHRGIPAPSHATILPMMEGGTLVLGSVYLDHEGDLVAQMAMTIAGPYAQARFQRRRTARLADVVRVSMEGQYSDWARVLLGCEDGPGTRLGEAMELARTIVTGEWRAIVAIAGALARYRELDGKMVQIIYARSSTNHQINPQPVRQPALA